MVTEPLEADKLKRVDLIKFLRDNPETSLQLLAGMAERLRRSGQQLEYAPVRDLNKLAEKELTMRDRVAKWIEQFAGSTPFLVLHVVFYALWVTINILLG